MVHIIDVSKMTKKECVDVIEQVTGRKMKTYDLEFRLICFLIIISMVSNLMVEVLK